MRGSVPERVFTCLHVSERVFSIQLRADSADRQHHFDEIVLVIVFFCACSEIQHSCRASKPSLDWHANLRGVSIFVTSQHAKQLASRVPVSLATLPSNAQRTRIYHWISIVASWYIIARIALSMFVMPQAYTW